MIKTIKLFVNTSKEKAFSISKLIEKELLLAGYIITDKNPDLVIGFGGDGTLLRWLSSENYNTTSKYIGVNCGTLGFMQEFEIEDAKTFAHNIENLAEDKIPFIKIEITSQGRKFKFSEST